MSEVTPAPGPAEQARAVMRAVDRAALATLARPDAPEAGSPYASLVLVALDHDASPLLLVSQLADHTRNLQADGRVSLLFDLQPSDAPAPATLDLHPELTHPNTPGTNPLSPGASTPP